jgi:serine/threonine protein kinase
MSSRDLFISHSSDDAEVARALRSDLEAAGYTCWMAPDDIVGTETWTEQILAAIEGSKAMIVLISGFSNRSPHVSREVNLALGRGRPVLPIRIEDVAPEGSLEYLLSLVQRVDAFPPPISDHRDRILRRLSSVVQPDPATDVEPDTSQRPRPGRRRKADAAGKLGPGSVVADFTIEAVLGEGGMATVYRASQDEPRRQVALKVIRADHAADESYRRRFLAETETLAALEHPSIVPIYAAGASDGVLYIAMRLVSGLDLQARIVRDGPLSLRDTITTLEPIADAVDHAHAMGIIHRDLKPSNIILDREGRPYLTDFGLGKQLGSGTQLSSPGIAIGTLDYMSPEQFTGAGDDAHAGAIDTYALGCVAFACLTGQPPFVRSSAEQLMYAHAHDVPPSLRSLRPEYPEVLDRVFEKVLAKAPADRYDSARSFIGALEEVVAAGSSGQTREVVIPGESSSLRRARSWMGTNPTLAVGGAVVACVAVVALAAAVIFRNPQPSLDPSGQGGPSSDPGGSGQTASAPPTSGPLNANELALEASLPILDSVTGACKRWLTPPGGPDVLSPSGYATSVARLSCPGPNGDPSLVEYARYESLADLETDYKTIMSEEGQAEGGDCSQATPANAEWSFPNQPVSGHLACFGRGGGVEWLWTQNQLRLLAQWQAPDNASGRAFWLSWTKTFNAAEAELVSRLPASVVDIATCNRAPDRYWTDALAILLCPRPDKFHQYFAMFPDPEDFPNDPMTRVAFNTLAAGDITADSAADAGCYNNLPGRHTWYFTGNDAPQGYVGCYIPNSNQSTTQFVWTYNRTAVLGWWAAPSFATGIEFVKAYNSAVFSITP